MRLWTANPIFLEKQKQVFYLFGILNWRVQDRQANYAHAWTSRAWFEAGRCSGLKLLVTCNRIKVGKVTQRFGSRKSSNKDFQGWDWHAFQLLIENPKPIAPVVRPTTYLPAFQIKTKQFYKPDAKRVAALYIRERPSTQQRHRPLYWKQQQRA